jgi:hypothetical protein
LTILLIGSAVPPCQFRTVALAVNPPAQNIARRHMYSPILNRPVTTPLSGSDTTREQVSTMRWRFLLPAAFAALTAACSSRGELQAGLERYRGEPVNELVARLGPASDTSSSAAGAAYVWSTGASLTGSSLSCALRVQVDGSRRITGSEWLGNYGSCRALSLRLQGQY